MGGTTTGCGGRQGLRWVGDPVDVVTGALADAAADFTLPLGPLPEDGAIAWRRYYSTANPLPGPLGHGHTHEYDRTLRAVVDGWLYRPPDGDVVLFPFVPSGDTSESAGFSLRTTPEGFALEHPDGTRVDFAAPKIDAVERPRKQSHGTWSIVLEHDARGRLVRVASEHGSHVLTLDYAGDRIQTVWLKRHPARQQPLALMRYQYDEAGDLRTATDRYGHAQRFTYDPAHRMLTRLDRNGYEFEYSYDAAGRCVLSRGHDRNGEVRLRYMPESQATEVTHADGGAWLYRYDASLSITEIIDPYGGIRRFEYDDLGGLTAETDAGGNIRRPVYDRLGEIVGWRTASGGLRPADSPSGPLPHRVPQTPAELELGDLAAEVLIEAPLVSPGIEPLFSGGASIYSRLFSERDPRTEAACRRDELGLLVEERGEAASPRRWAYTPNGWVRWYTDHDGGRYEFEFVGGNMRAAARDPLGRTIRYEYTLTDQIAAVTDPAGNRHTYRYDLRDALTEVHHFGRLVETYEYDRAGNLTVKRDANGEPLVTYAYGADGLKSRRRLADGEEHRYTYTPNGQFARIEWSGHALEFAYTGLGRRRKDVRDGVGVEHVFLGDRLTATTALGRFTTRYERIDEQTLELTDPLGNVHRLVLESDGVVTRHLACGARELAQVDSRGRIREKHLIPAAQGEPAWRRKFAYSAEGDLLAVQDSERGETRYRYDAAHQLAEVTRPDGQIETYRYDEAANLIEAPHLAAVAIGPGNQLLAANGSSLSYDHRNNLSVWERDGRTLRFHRNSLDQIREIEGLAAPWTADYDPLGRRTRKTFGAASTEYYWDTDRLAAEVHSDGRVRIYVYVDAFSLTPWLMIDYAAIDAEPSSGTLHYLVTDQRGAPVAALDAGGKRVWSAKLAPYGLAAVEGKLEVAHRLAGQLYDAETGLCYNRFRYYSPEFGRYIEEDPAGTGGGLNVYAYTYCAMVQSDPRGLSKKLDKCTGIGASQDKSEEGSDTKPPNPAESSAPTKGVPKPQSLTVPADMQMKVLYGTRKDPPKNKLIGAHSPRIKEDPDFAVEIVRRNDDGTTKVKLCKQYDDGNISNLESNKTLAPDSWSDLQIIEATERVGASPVEGVRSADGATVHHQKIDGVEWQVIKNKQGEITSSYPTGGSTELPSDFTRI